MKKIMTMLCAGVCAFGMTACGDEENYMTPIEKMIDGCNQANAVMVFESMYSDWFMENVKMSDKESAAEAKSRVVYMLEEEIEELRIECKEEYGSAKLNYKKVDAEPLSTAELAGLKDELREEAGIGGMIEAYYVYIALYAGENLIDGNVEAITVKIGDSWSLYPDCSLVNRYL